jgi:hypothetical protein
VKDQRYVFEPMPRFITKKGKLDARVKNDKVMINMEMYPDDLADQFLQQKKRAKLINEAVTTAQVEPVKISKLIFQTPATYEPYIEFELIENPTVLPARQEIVAKAPSEQAAQQLLADLEDGNASLEMVLVLPGYDLTENYAKILVKDVATAALKEQGGGAGGEGYVNRRQIARIAKELLGKLGVIITNECADPAFDKLAEDTVKETLNREKGKGKEIDFDLYFKAVNPKDFQSDVVNSARTVLSNEKHQKFEKELEKHFAADVKISGNLLGIISTDNQFSINQAERAKILNDVLDKYNVDRPGAAQR